VRITSLVLLAALAVSLPATLFGVDGVILIDQNKAMAGDVTSGDAPGFPVTISQPGSYRLDSNLTVPDVNTTAIIIASDNVTIDLNGFAIHGNNVCGLVTFGPATFFSCAPSGLGSAQGRGITTTGTGFANVTIRNGTIQGMGDSGIYLLGRGISVEQVHAVSNGAFGIAIYEASVYSYTDFSPGIVGSNAVKDRVVMSNRTGGILVEGLATNNSAVGNDDDGISVFLGAANNNISQGNRGFGLSLSGSSYAGNVVRFNHAPFVFKDSESINMGQNLCDSSVCP
jgi:hypothetical protein